MGEGEGRGERGEGRGERGEGRGERREGRGERGEGRGVGEEEREDAYSKGNSFRGSIEREARTLSIRTSTVIASYPSKNSTWSAT